MYTRFLKWVTERLITARSRRCEPGSIIIVVEFTPEGGEELRALRDQTGVPSVEAAVGVALGFTRVIVDYMDAGYIIKAHAEDGSHGITLAGPEDTPALEVDTGHDWN